MYKVYKLYTSKVSKEKQYVIEYLIWPRSFVENFLPSHTLSMVRLLMDHYDLVNILSKNTYVTERIHLC